MSQTEPCRNCGTTILKSRFACPSCWGRLSSDCRAAIRDAWSRVSKARKGEDLDALCAAIKAHRAAAEIAKAEWGGKSISHPEAAS